MWRTALFVLVLVVAVSSGGLASAATYTRKVCSVNPPAGTARCNAIIASPGQVPQVNNKAQGYGPADFKSAYGVSGSSTTHVAVVVAYDAPNIQNDVNVFSKNFGLPTMAACTSTTQTGCLEKLDQHGGKSYPVRNSSWAVEASLDVESVHGMCPGCRISLVEATSPSMDNLTAAVDTAIASGAKVVSNSYGGAESSGETAYDKHYKKSGVTMVASSGDNGYGTSYPAASPNVVAVGGTTLNMKSGKVSSETAWSGAGSGCSQFETKPSWQHDTKCAKRSIADVSADADPNTGAAIYDSYASDGQSGWFTVGGTSLAAPLIAGMLAVSGNYTNQPTALYTSATLRDITSGTNGTCSTYLCRAGTGYDGPTGLGVPHGSKL